MEKIFFEISGPVNLANYLLYDATFGNEDELSNKGQHVYHFPAHAADAGDEVLLYIGEGPRKGNQCSVTANGKQTIGHRFYWNRKSPLINNTGDKLTLIKIEPDKEQVFVVRMKK